MTKLGDYLNQMRLRHPRLSMRRMSIECGLSENAISKMISGEIGARPETLKAIADRWGSDQDYRELLRLAGHPLPEPQRQPSEPVHYDVDAALQIVREARDILSVESKDALIAALIGPLQAQAVIDQLSQWSSIAPNPDEEKLPNGPLEYDEEFLKTASFDKLLELTMQMSEEERRRWLAHSIWRILQRSGRKSFDDEEQ